MALAFQLFSKPAVAGITFESHTVKFTLIVLNFPAVAGINSFALIKPQIGKGLPAVAGIMIIEKISVLNNR